MFHHCSFFRQNYVYMQTRILVQCIIKYKFIEFENECEIDKKRVIKHGFELFQLKLQFLKIVQIKGKINV